MTTQSKWPPSSEIQKIVAQWKDAENFDEEKWVERYAMDLECKWLDTLCKQSSTPMPLVELINEYTMITSNLGDDTKGYSSPEKVFKQYYSHIEYRIFNQLYNEFKCCLSIDELQELIPFVDSEFYRRERIILSYMKTMHKLKHRGEEWEQMIILTEQLLANETPRPETPPMI